MHRKKMIAPIVITIFVIIYMICYGIGLIYIKGMPLFVNVLGFVIPVIVSGICIYVLIERIKEIRSGEEDDLSKY